MPEQQVGIVIIGRNEGSRLIECLRTAAETALPLIYVDSGSSDRSIEEAKQFTNLVYELSHSLPFSAARARNEGFDFLLNEFPSIEYVQFVDGDCKIEAGWLEQATSYLDQNSQCAIVCGLLQEEFPEKSIYNHLCQIEWDQSIGETKSCGGIFLCRAEAFKSVSGFDLNFSAGEEPELCLRLRSKGWKIFRLNTVMCKHDANILTLSEYVKRIKRSGYAYGLGFIRHGFTTERYHQREVFRIVFWGLIIPLLFVASLLLEPIFSLFLVLLIIFQIARITIKLTNKYNFSVRLAYSASMVFGKHFEFLGLLRSFLVRT